MENFYPSTLDNFNRVEYNGQPVIVTTQLAQFYECEPRHISDNFKRNEEHFIDGKHFFKLEGTALADLRSAESGLQISPMTRSLYLWTKRGAARHAKMLNTDKAWEVFEALEDTYFNQRVEKEIPPVSDFERGTELAKLAPHTKDPLTKARLVAKAANLILGENFIDIPDANRDYQISLFYRQ